MRWCYLALILPHPQSRLLAGSRRYRQSAQSPRHWRYRWAGNASDDRVIVGSTYPTVIRYRKHSKRRRDSMFVKSIKCGETASAGTLCLSRLPTIYHLSCDWPTPPPPPQHNLNLTPSIISIMATTTPRTRFACAACTRRKVKCSKTVPCTNCARR